MKTIRSFIAFPISEALRGKLGSVQETLGKNMSHLRPVKPHGIHLTLSFLGDLSENQVYQVGSVMDEVCAKHHPMDLLCRRLGGFPDLDRPRVLWAGLEGDIDRLSAFHKDLIEGLEIIGFPPEERGFSPHLTLFRLKDQKQMGALRKRIEALSKETFGEIRCDTLVLYRSDLRPEGAMYSKLKMTALD